LTESANQRQTENEKELQKSKKGSEKKGSSMVQTNNSNRYRYHCFEGR